MEDAFHVPASTRSERLAVLFVGAPLFSIVAAVHVAIGMPWFALPYAAMVCGTLWTVWRGFRIARRGVVFDAEGLGPAEDGVRLWTLPWRDYGGFRRTRTTLWERVRYPERSGYEVLDRLGPPAFVLSLPSGGSATGALVRTAMAELRSRLPEGATDPTIPVLRPPRRRNVALGLFLAVAGFALAFVGLANPLSSLMPWGAMGALVGAMGLLVAVMEAINLRRWAGGWRPPLPPPDPEEGPTAERHRLGHGRLPIALQEGCRYRTVDPERRRRDLRSRMLASHGAWIGVSLAGGSVYGLFADPRAWPLLIASALWWSAIAAHGFDSERTERALLGAVDDVLWVDEGHLVVVRSIGEPLVLPLPSIPDRKALRNLALRGATDLWRLPDGARYALDRTRLYAAPHTLGGML